MWLHKQNKIEHTLTCKYTDYIKHKFYHVLAVEDPIMFRGRLLSSQVSNAVVLTSTVWADVSPKRSISVILLSSKHDITLSTLSPTAW